jgi:putative hydrolase of the HAD superfamily
MRAIFFDAVGTLIHPEPDAATVYAQIGLRFGSRHEVRAIRQRFAAAFARQEQLDRLRDWRTDETREVERWRQIVAEVLSDVADGERCFAALYEHFSLARNWRCEPATGAVLQTLANRGFRIGIASNFDGRLRQVLQGFAELAALDPVVISSEVGWRKPATAFFEALCRASGATPDQVLYVGDDLVNDYEGARRAGCRALLLAQANSIPSDVQAITHLAAVLDMV